MDLRTLLQPLDAEAKRTGVNYLPESIVNDEWSLNNWHFAYSQDAASLIAEASIVRFLAGPKRCRDSEWIDLWYDDASLQSLIAASLTVYATLPDAAKLPARATDEAGEGKHGN